MALALYVTTGCNLNCRYCFNWETDGKQTCQNLDYPDICHILTAARQKGHRHLTITGGEPFLHKDILKIIDYAYGLGYLINILTNALLIDDPIERSLCGKSRLRMRVSLDGASKKVHEYFRGSNTFDKTLSVIRKMVDDNIYVGIGFTVYPENIDDIDDVVRLCINLKCRFLRFSPVVRIRKGKQAKIDRTLHKETLIRIVAAQLKYKDYLTFPSFDHSGLSVPIEAIITKRCEAGCNFFGVNPGKIILPCPLIRQDARVFRKKFTGKDDFDEVHRHTEELFNDVTRNLKGLCASCEFSKSCCGGCLAEKLSYDLTFYDDQPVCYKRILQDIDEHFRNQDIEFLKKSWIYQVLHLQEKNATRFCLRHAPFWTILFKETPVEAIKGEKL